MYSDFFFQLVVLGKVSQWKRIAQNRLALQIQDSRIMIPDKIRHVRNRQIAIGRVVQSVNRRFRDCLNEVGLEFGLSFLS